MANHDQTLEHGDHGSHGSPLRYTIIWVLLLIGTILTFTVAQLPRGDWTLPIALLIATCKATLVALFFMHLYGDKGLPKMVLLTAVTLFVLLISLLMTDLHFRFPLVTPRGVELPDPTARLAAAFRTRHAGKVSDDRRVAEKQAVAEAASTRLTDGMRLGVGSGSTLELFVPLLAARIAAGLRIACVATSNRIAQLGGSLGVTFEELDERPLNLAIDGADELDPQGQLVKGAGGAMVRERIVAAAARHFLVLVDSSKLVARLGERMPLPVEVQPFGLPQTTRRVAALMGRTRLRAISSGEPFVTDNAGRILDCSIPSGKTPQALMAELHAIPGVVDAGFFLDFHPEVLVARDGRVDALFGG